MTRRAIRPRRHLAFGLLLACALARPGLAHADEVRLHDGRVLVGEVTRQGDKTLTIHTRDGAVVVNADQVAAIRTADTLREDLAAMARNAGKTRFAALNLAAQARAYGLEPEMWRHLDRAVVPDPQESSPALERRLADFLAHLGPELLPRQFRSSPVALRIKKLLEGVRADTSPGRAAAIEELLVREEGADQELRRQVRNNPTPRRRIAALRALERRELDGNHRFVLRTTFLDGSPEVREAAAAIARPDVGADDIDYLANGLVHPNAKVRQRTAEAFGELGHADAVKLLVMAGPNAAAGLAGGGGSSPRAYIAFVNQQAYIRDFDVEVAQAAFIAEPKVDVLQSGTVLDVTVVGVVEERIIIQAYRRALQKLTRLDPGADPRSWANWLANLQPQQPASPAATTGKH